MISSQWKKEDTLEIHIHAEIAAKIGLNEAVFLSRLHEVIDVQKDLHPDVREVKVKDDRFWLQRKLDGWSKELPFWSKSTVGRVIDSLKKKHLLDECVFGNTEVENPQGMWYAIKYEILEKLKL